MLGLLSETASRLLPLGGGIAPETQAGLIS
jgi:hypothetical protein